MSRFPKPNEKRKVGKLFAKSLPARPIKTKLSSGSMMIKVGNKDYGLKFMERELQVMPMSERNPDKVVFFTNGVPNDEHMQIWGYRGNSREIYISTAIGAFYRLNNSTIYNIIKALLDGIKHLETS